MKRSSCPTERPAGLEVNPGVRPKPDQLAQELRLVLKFGTRPAKLVDRLDLLPGLIACSGEIAESTPWDQAIALCALVQRAIGTLGDGEYGESVAALFGTATQTRGLPLGRRRAVVAEVLDRQLGTVIRWWEPAAVLDIAVAIYASSNGRVAT